MEPSSSQEASSCNRRRVVNEAISTTWDSIIRSEIHHLIADEMWISFLINVIKIGRLSFGLNKNACEYFYKIAFPSFFVAMPSTNLHHIIIDAMCGNCNYNGAIERLQKPGNLDENELKAYKLYEKVFLNMGEDVTIPAIEFHRTFDMKSIELVNMAVNTNDDELQEGPMLTLAKWSLAIPSRKGLLTIHGTNMFFSKNESSFDLHTQLSIINSGFILSRLKQQFRIIDNFHSKDLRLGCVFQGFDIYVTLSLITCTCTFDTDVLGKFINIPIEPYPYDTISDFERICISIYVPDETISKTVHLKIINYIIEIILDAFNIKTTEFYILSNFTQFPLIPFSTVYRYPLQFDMYNFHKYLISFRTRNYWTFLKCSPYHIPRIMSHDEIECMLVVHRPIISSIPFTNDDRFSKTMNLFLQFWSVDDAIEIHCKLSTTCSRNEVTDLFRSKKKTISFRTYNGFVRKCINELTVDVLDDVFNKYDKLLHLWIAAVFMFERYFFLKTWTDEEQKQLKVLNMSYKFGFSLNTLSQLKRIITSVNKFYFVTNTFSGKVNVVNVAEIMQPDLSFTLIFDFPVQIFDLKSSQNIVIDEKNITNNFKPINSLKLAKELLTFKDENLLLISDEKYILQCPKLPAVILIGQNWNETDAVNITKYTNNLSRNIIQTIQGILCKNTIMKCIVKTI